MKNFLKIIFTSFMFFLFVKVVFADCQSKDWTSEYVNKSYSKNDEKLLVEFFNNSPILIFGKILSSKKITAHPGFKPNKVKSSYFFSVKVLSSFKGKNIEGKTLGFHYEWVASKPPVPTPKKGEKWVLRADKLNPIHSKKSQAIVSRTLCGQLGFPESQTNIFSALKKIHKNHSSSE